MIEKINRSARVVAQSVGLTHNKDLGDEDLLYLHLLINDYNMLETDVHNEKAHAAADAVIKKVVDKQQLTWQDVQAMERAMLSLLPNSMLQRQAWNLRALYRDMVGADVYDLYLKSGPPEIADQPHTSELVNKRRHIISMPLAALEKPEEGVTGEKATGKNNDDGSRKPDEASNGNSSDSLRSDLLMLLSEIQWLYIYWPSREKIRNGLYFWVVVFAVSMGGIALAAYFYHDKHGTGRGAAVAPLVAFCGVLGAFISTQTRLYSLPKGVHMINLYEMRLSPLSVLLPMVSGGVFALVLYLAFVGNLVEGTMFPKMGLNGRPTAPVVVTATSQESTATQKAVASKAAADKAEKAYTQAEQESTKLAAIVEAIVDQKSGQSQITQARNAAQEAERVAAERNQEYISALKQQSDDASATAQVYGARQDTPSAAGNAAAFSFRNLNSTEPQSIPDFAKLLIWAFIAGFAERFVPDNLDRLIGKAQSIKSSQKT